MNKPKACHECGCDRIAKETETFLFFECKQYYYKHDGVWSLGAHSECNTDLSDMLQAARAREELKRRPNRDDIISRQMK